MLVTPEYRDVLKQMHERDPWGTKGWRSAPDIIAWYNTLRCTSLLDYGCGCGSLRAWLGTPRSEGDNQVIDVRCYDVGIPGWDEPPKPADLVVCTDVLEHVEPDLIGDVLAHLHSLMIKGAYLNIALTPAKRTLPDGRNAHLILQPSEWWLHMMRKWGIAKTVPGQKSLKVWVRK